MLYAISIYNVTVYLDIMEIAKFSTRCEDCNLNLARGLKMFGLAWYLEWEEGEGA
eukprot:SAG31_NODE_3033_length_4764_cov_1.641372_1_plen_54_part_10